MNYLSKTITIKSMEELEQIIMLDDGILILSDNQDVISMCENKGFPVAGFEHDNITGLKCDNVLLDVDDVDDDVFEFIYRRCKGIPVDIAETERTFIREFCMDDLDNLFELYQKPGITDYMESLFPYEEEKIYEQNYIEYIYKLYGFGMWLVFDKITGELIGRAGIEAREETCNEPAMVELGFCISPDRWQTGLGYEVCSKIIEIAFDEFEIEKIVSRCDPKNLASRALLEKLDFELVSYRDDGDCFYRFRGNR